MLFHVGRSKLEEEVRTRYGFIADEAVKIVQKLEIGGQLGLTTTTVDVKQPTTVDGPLLQGLARQAAGRSSGAVPDARIREYLDGVLRRP